MSKIMVFPRPGEFEKAKAGLDGLNLSYRVLDPTSGYENVAVPAIVFEQDAYACLVSSAGSDFIYSGCVDYRPPAAGQPENQEEEAFEDVFGRAQIMVLLPCVADETKIRLVAHLSEEISHVLPYMNAYMRCAYYNDDAQSLTFMEGHRLVTVYRNKIAIARADEITDAWRLLAKIRGIANHVYHNKSSIVPSYEMRKQPAAIEIYNRLPKINCGQCLQKTCMAFAFSLRSGGTSPFACKPVFEGEYKHLREAYMEITASLGAAAEVE